MSSPRSICLPGLLILTTVCLAASCTRSVSGQSPSIPSSGPLEVDGAAYDPRTDAIEINLHNSGTQPITAYCISVTTGVNNAAPAKVDISTDLLDVVLLNQASSGDTTSWKGALLPGTTTAVSLSAAIAKRSTQPPQVSVQATATCAIQADGTVSGTDTSTLDVIQNARVDRDQKESAVVVALEAHKNDSDLSHRIDATLTDLDKLDRRRAGARSVQSDTQTDPVFGEAKANLQHLRAVSTDPDALTQFISFYESRHKIRHNLVRTTAPSPTI